MKYSMLDKEIIEQQKFVERQGMINIYACGNCRNVITYLYANSGITPADILCNCCGQRMYSQFSSVRQPSKVWYRPKTLKELEDIADTAHKHCGGDIELILNEYIMWYNKGGLFAINM